MEQSLTKKSTRGLVDEVLGRESREENRSARKRKKVRNQEFACFGFLRETFMGLKVVRRVPAAIGLSQAQPR